jgi:hypothetical protein
LTDLIAIEDAIVNQLQPLTAEYGARVGKLDAAELNLPVEAVRVFVSYDSTEYQRQATFNSPEIATITFDVLINIANIQTHSEAYPLMNAIRDRLYDFKPTENVVQAMRLLRQRFVEIQDDEDSIWIFSQTFSFDVFEV